MTAELGPAEPLRLQGRPGSAAAAARPGAGRLCRCSVAAGESEGPAPPLGHQLTTSLCFCGAIAVLLIVAVFTPGVTAETRSQAVFVCVWLRYLCCLPSSPSGRTYAVTCWPLFIAVLFL